MLNDVDALCRNMELYDLSKKIIIAKVVNPAIRFKEYAKLDYFSMMSDDEYCDLMHKVEQESAVLFQDEANVGMHVMDTYMRIQKSLLSLNRDLTSLLQLDDMLRKGSIKTYALMDAVKESYLKPSGFGSDESDDNNKDT